MIGDIKHIVVIQSLPHTERQSGKELYDDVIVRHIDRVGSEITCQFYNVNDLTSLIRLLNHLNDIAQYVPGGIVIHFEMHGSVDLNGLILANGALVNWDEMIALLRPINITTTNQLYVTMATCFGRYLYKGVDPYLKSPYSGYISASNKVGVDEIIEDFGLLFEHSIEMGNLVNAFLMLDKQGSNFYYKDSQTTFTESIRNVKDRLDNDIDFRDNLLKDIRTEFKNKGVDDNPEDIHHLIKIVYNDLVNKQRKAFEFP
jgi:hypothetical protein